MINFEDLKVGMKVVSRTGAKRWDGIEFPITITYVGDSTYAIKGIDGNEDVGHSSGYGKFGNYIKEDKEPVAGEIRESILKTIKLELSADDSDSLMPNDLFTLWFNRVQELELLSSIEDQFGIDIDVDEWAHLIDTEPTIENVVIFIENEINQGY